MKSPRSFSMLCGLMLGLSLSAPARGQSTAARLLVESLPTGYLLSSDLQKELQLTADQIQRLEQARRQYSAGRWGPGAIDGRAARVKAAQDAIDATLSADQVRRFRQILLQQQARSSPIAGYRDREFVAELGLSAEQTTQLQAILDEYGKQSQSYRDALSEVSSDASRLPTEEQRQKASELADKNTQFRKAVEAKLQSLLTADQQAKSKELLGAPYQGRLIGNRDGGEFGGSSSRLGNLSAPETRFLLEPRFHDELKLSPDQAERLKRAAAVAPPDRVELVKIFSADQLGRARELTLQYAVQANGPLGPLNYAFVMEALAPTVDQKRKLQTLGNEMSSSYTNLRRRRAEDTQAERAELDRQCRERLAAILTAEQQEKLNGMIGKPFDGNLEPPSWSFTFTAGLGSNADDVLPYFRHPQFHAELKLSPEQVKQTWQLPNRGSVALAELEKTFSAAQLRRANELALQATRQRMGPAGPLGIQSVVEALALSNEQLATLKTLVGEALTQRMRGIQSSTADLDRQCEERIAAVLTSEQQAKLKALLGEPYQGQLGPAFSGGSGGFPGRGPGGSRGLGFKVGQSSVPFGQIVRVPVLYDELKLTPEQRQATRQLPSHLSADEAAQLEKMLTSEQMRRVRELTLQNYRLLWGPVGPFLSQQVVDSLQLTAEQKSQAQTLLDALQPSPGRGATAAANRDRTADAKLAEILNAEQQAKLKELLGTPYPRDLRSVLQYRNSVPSATSPDGFSSRDFTRGGALAGPFKLGDLAPPTSGYTTYPAVQAHLKLSPEQVAKIGDYARARDDARGQRESKPPAVQMTDILTAEQLARVAQINVQGRRRIGPAEIFRYPHVVQAVGLSDEQRTKLEAIGEEFRRVAPGNASFSAAKVAAAKTAQEQIDSLLSPDQQAKLKEVLGEPFDFSLIGDRSDRR